MFAKRIVTKAVSKTCLFCDACMRMIDDTDDYVVSSFHVYGGETYSNRTLKTKDRFIICRKCYEHIAGSYEVHQQIVQDGNEGAFHKDGITEEEMRALMQFNPDKPASGVSSNDDADGGRTANNERGKFLNFCLPLRRKKSGHETGGENAL